MTAQIATLLAILFFSVVLFITEWIRLDIVALMVMVSLTLTGLITPVEAISGFSNPAVIVVWSVLILTASLNRTGVANWVGDRLFRLAGKSETGLVVAVMLLAGVLSGFMNNVGVVAMLLPVVIDLARRSGRPPSKLLMPLVYATFLGGLVTLIGTPPNLIVSEVLREAGYEPFRMFDYAPMGLILLLVGIAFIATVGRRLLPVRDIAKEFSHIGTDELEDLYDIKERLYKVKTPTNSRLDGKTLAESRLGSALGLNVIAILREKHARLAPGPETVLRSQDELLVGGRLDLLDELHGRRHLILENDNLATQRLVSGEVTVAEVKLSLQSTLVGKTVRENELRHRFRVNVLAICRGGSPILTGLQNVKLKQEDRLLVQAQKQDLDGFAQSEEVESLRSVSVAEMVEGYQLNERLIGLRVPPESFLAEKTLAESRLGDAFGLEVLGIHRAGEAILMPDPREPLLADDWLLVEGDPEELRTLRGLQELEIDVSAEPDLNDYESERVGLAEVILSPHSALANKTLRQLHFREKYGLSVLAIWRGNRPYRSNLRDMPLKFGDALLLYGPREKLKVLGSEPDFLVLTVEAQEAPRLRKAPLAVLIMALALASVVFNWLPLTVATLSGMILMVLTGCITMDEAYRAIEWKAIFLIAGMLPLSIAMDRTGAADFIGRGIIDLLGAWGPTAVSAGLFLLTALATQIIPYSAVAVIFAPIALNIARDMGISPYPLMMLVAISISASFLSPLGHPAKLIVMSPAGYRLKDFFKAGLPLTLVLLLTVLLVLPWIWPFS